MRAPEYAEDGSFYIRFLDMSEDDLDERNYPGHPPGRYVSLEDLQRVADNYEDETLWTLIARVREALSLEELVE